MPQKVPHNFPRLHAKAQHLCTRMLHILQTRDVAARCDTFIVRSRFNMLTLCGVCEQLLVAWLFSCSF